MQKDNIILVGLPGAGKSTVGVLLAKFVGKGFLESFAELNADIFCLQETKMQAGQLDLDLPGYHQYWNYADKKGYSGTAVLQKLCPSPCNTASALTSTITRAVS